MGTTKGDHDWSCLEQHREIFRFTRGMEADKIGFT